MAFSPTAAQQNIYDFIVNGSGNGIIDAVAGAGKTTTLMNCVSYIPNIDDVVYCAFNVSIRNELQKKFKSVNKNIKVATIHSLGFNILRSNGDYKIDNRKYINIVREPAFFNTLLDEINQILGMHGHITVEELKLLRNKKDKLSWEEKNKLNEGESYVNTIITRLLDINNKYRCTLQCDTINGYDEMIHHFDIIPSYECTHNKYLQEVTLYFRAHQKLLKEGNSIAISHGIIDFTDQLYLPYVTNLTAKTKYGFVFVDECQDLSKAQVYIVKQYLREGGRLLAVGDPYQAIYGFAGADCNSFEGVKDAFNCTLLGLTDCFRCPQCIIQLAQSIRPDIRGFKQYPGKLYDIKEYEVIVNIKQGDLIICRERNPLMNIALQLVNKNYKVRIHPDELQEFIGEYKKIFNTQELRNTLSEYMIDDFFENVLKRNEKRIRSEIQNVDEVIRSNLINEQINIMSDTLRFLKSKYFDWHLNTLDNIFKRLKLMLSSTSEEAIKISTIHRAKGLENDRVFILKYNKLPYKRKLEWEQIQERNLHYVAVTRPKEELYLCMEDKFEGNEEELKSAIPLDHELCINNKKSEINDERQNGINIFTDNSVLLQFENDTEKVEDVIPPVIPSIGSPISFLPIQRINKIQDKFYAFDKYEDTPYPSLNQRLCQKAKYWSIYDNIKDTEFTISNVISTQYMDEYYIDTPTGIEIYKGRYKNSGQYTFTPQGTCGNREKILSILSNESNYKIKFNYEPQNSGFDSVHGLIQAFCQDLGVCNTNIYAENYALVYCFKMPDSYAYLRMTYNKHNVITTIASFSIIGEEDRTLRLLLEELKHLWQL